MHSGRRNTSAATSLTAPGGPRRLGRAFVPSSTAVGKLALRPFLREPLSSSPSISRRVAALCRGHICVADACSARRGCSRKSRAPRAPCRRATTDTRTRRPQRTAGERYKQAQRAFSDLLEQPGAIRRRGVLSTPRAKRRSSAGRLPCSEHRLPARCAARDVTPRAGPVEPRRGRGPSGVASDPAGTRSRPEPCRHLAC